MGRLVASLLSIGTGMISTRSFLKKKHCRRSERLVLLVSLLISIEYWSWGALTHANWSGPLVTQEISFFLRGQILPQECGAAGPLLRAVQHCN